VIVVDQLEERMVRVSKALLISIARLEGNTILHYGSPPGPK
jgi:hypothetical protein